MNALILAIISALYFILDIEHCLDQGLVFELLSHQANEIKSYCQNLDNPNECKLFGEQNYNRINDVITVYGF